MCSAMPSSPVSLKDHNIETTRRSLLGNSSQYDNCKNCGASYEPKECSYCGTKRI